MSEEVPVRELRRSDVIADPYVPDVRLKVVDITRLRYGDMWVTVVQQQRSQRVEQKLTLGADEMVTVLERGAPPVEI